MVGSHYVARFYLSGFDDPSRPGYIRRYEKGITEVIFANVGKVAIEKGYYSEEIEAYLRDEIESPAHTVLRKVRSQEVISEVDRKALSVYLLAMLKRVPNYRQIIYDLGVEEIEPFFDDVDRRLAALKETNPAKAELLESRRTEVRQLRSTWEAQFPSDKIHNASLSTVSEELTRRVSEMTWVFLVAPDPLTFLTNDNPVFWFKKFGIANKESELTFPISRDITLWATQRSDLQQGFRRCSAMVLKEINRRTIYNATRYVFGSFEEEWILAAVNRKSHQLHRILSNTRLVPYYSG